jgi:cation transporter-like permease
MAENNNISALKQALGLSVSMLSSEHIFSATLSSPWTTGKLTQTEQDQNAFWTLFSEAAIASVIFAIVIGVILQDLTSLIVSLIGTSIIISWMYFDYSRALSGELYQ